MKIGFDIDGVKINFVDNWLQFLKKEKIADFKLNDVAHLQFEALLGWSTGELYARFQKHYDSEFFEKMEFIGGAREALAKIAQNNEIYVVTSRPAAQKHKTDKLLRENLPFLKEILYSKNESGMLKAELCKKHGISIFVEDNWQYALECAESGTHTILFGQPWNLKYKADENFVRVGGTSKEDFEPERYDATCRKTWDGIVEIINSRSGKCGNSKGGGKNGE